MRRLLELTQELNVFKKELTQRHRLKYNEDKKLNRT